MPRTTLALPFPRTVKFVGEARQFAQVVDMLPVSLEMVPETGLPYDAVERHEGDTRYVIVVHDGKPYEGHLKPWTGLPQEKVAAAMQADIDQRLSPRSLEWLSRVQVLDDGKAVQERERAWFEEHAVSSRGRLYELCAAPTVDLCIDDGQVRVSTEWHRPTRTDAWMRFPLDRRADALDMAAHLSETLRDFSPAMDWRRHHGKGVNALSFSHWSVTSPDRYAGVGHAHGGNGTEGERHAAFARDLVRAVTADIGAFPVATIRAYADLREAMGSGTDVRDALENLAVGLRDAPRPETGRGQAAEIDAARLAGFLVATRLEGWEPREEPGPRP